MHSFVFISYFAGLICLFIAIYVYQLNPEKIAYKVITLLIIIFSLYGFGEFICRIAHNPETALSIGRICYIALIFTGVNVVYIGLVFPREYPKNAKWYINKKIILPLLYGMGFIIYIYYNITVNLEHVIMSEWGYRVVVKESSLFTVLFFLITLTYGIGIIIHSYYKMNLTNSEKRGLRVVGLSLLIMMLIGLSTNVIPPFFGIQVYPTVSTFATLLSITFVISLIKLNLLNPNLEKTKILIESMNYAMISVDKDNLIINVNQSGYQLLKYSKKELINKNVKKIISEDSINFNNISKEIPIINLELITKHNKKIPVKASISPIYQKQQHIGTLIIARDSRQEEITKEMLESYKKLKTSNEQTR